jgi:hypothetical protein
VSRVLPLLLAASTCFAQKIPAPRIWNDQSLAEWATPVTGLNVRPGHFTEKEYYSARQGEWVRTYPVYFPGREPSGYWETMLKKRPEPLIRPGARTLAEWIAAGEVVFQELDFPGARSYDPKHFAILRSPEEFKKMGGHPQKDGTVQGLRLVPTSRGLAVSTGQCTNCHLHTMPDGSHLDGAPTNDSGNMLIGELFSVLDSFPGESPAMFNWRSFAIPWIPNDIHAAIRTMPQKELDSLLDSNIDGTFPRFNGSP